jgi:hypothetical protein
MAKPKPDIKNVCGKITVTFPGDCSYVCTCTPNAGCRWRVTCGDWTTGGTGLIAGHPRQPHTSLVGKLEVCAKLLEQTWKRSVIVPAKLRRRRIPKRTFRGTPEQIAQALGLKLGPKRKR